MRIRFPESQVDALDDPESSAAESERDDADSDVHPRKSAVDAHVLNAESNDRVDQDRRTSLNL